MAWTAADGRRRWIHSSIDPIGEAQKVAASAIMTNDCAGAGACNVVLVGHGAGHVIRALAERVETVCVIAANLPLLRAVCDHLDVSDILNHPKIFWIYGSPAEMRRRLSELPASRQATLVIHPPFLDLVPPACADLIDAIRQIQIGRDTEDLLRPVAEDNLRQNLSALASPGVARIFGAANGRPVIVAGAGPTLDEGLSTIRRLYPASILVAVDTVAEGLVNAEIVPDFVVSVDPRPESIMHFQYLLNGRSKNAAGGAMTLVFTPITHPEVVRRFAGRRLLAIPRNHFLLKPAQETLARKGVLTSGGSVSVLAAALAAALDPACVCLTGVDFRTAPGRFYSRLASYHRAADTSESRFTSPELLEHEIQSREIRDTPDGEIAPRLKNYASDFRHVVSESAAPFYALGRAPVEGVRTGDLPAVTTEPLRRPIEIPENDPTPVPDIIAMLGISAS